MAFPVRQSQVTQASAQPFDNTPRVAGKPAPQRQAPAARTAPGPLSLQTAQADTQALLDAALAENARLREANAHRTRVSLKVSEKGAISAYGLGRFPTTLYREQWERLLAAHNEIDQFILDHASELSSK
jgi:hypothetical protein